MRLRIAFLAVVIFWLSIKPGLAASNERWAELMQKGRDLQWDRKCQEAASFYKQALAQAEALGEDDPRLTGSLLMLGRLYGGELDQSAAAAKYLERQQAILIKKLGPDFQGLCDGMDELARAYIRLGRYAEAEKLFLRALEIRPTGLFLNSIDFNFVLMSHLGDCYLDWKKYADAERCYSNTVNYSLKLYPHEDDDSLRIAYNKLGNLYKQTKRYNRAIAAYENCLRVSKILFKFHPDWSDLNYNEALYQWNLGVCYSALARSDEALACFRSSVKAASLAHDAWKLKMDSLYPGIAVIERKRGHQAEAARCASQALTLTEQHKNGETNAVAKEIRWFLGDLSRRP